MVFVCVVGILFALAHIILVMVTSGALTVHDCRMRSRDTITQSGDSRPRFEMPMDAVQSVRRRRRMEEA